MFRNVTRVLMVLALLVAAPFAAFAQEATLTGTVTDSTGGVLPGVTITATQTATGNTFVGVTDEKGGFRIPVRVGLLKVDAELPGFGTVSRQVEMLVGQTATLNLQLSPSTVQESVTVTGEAPLVDTTSSSMASNVDPRQMQDLPVNGRNWMDLTLLAPGSRSNAVTETPIGSTGSNVPFQLNLDGQQVTNLVAVGFGQPRFSRDAIGEFEYVSNRFDASQGRSSGIQVNAITKSGTNTPSGTFSGYFRDQKFNAKDPVALKVLPYQDQQISGTFGGPIRKDRIHFFASYEYEREPQTYVYDNPLYAKFRGTLTGARRQDTEMARLDFQFSPKTRLSIRGNRYDNRLPYDPRYTGGPALTPASAIGTNRRSEQEFGDLTQVLNSSMVNRIQGGHSVFHWNQYSHTSNANSLPGQTKGFGAPVITLTGLTIGQLHNLTPQDIGQELWNIKDEFTATFNKSGRHDLHMGGEYMHDFTFESVCSVCMGVYTATGGPIPANIESLFPNLTDVTTWNLAPLSPIVTQYQRGIAMTNSPFSRPSGNDGFTEYAPRHVMASWAQDNWTMGKLTLNVGVRYDVAVGAYVNWVEYQPFVKAGRPNDRNNIAPRLGFAYSLNDKTVIRGGYGRYYGTPTSQPALFTLRGAQQVSALLQNDGRPDFASNPFNGPAPTFDQAKARLCAFQADQAAVSGCIRSSFTNFVAPDLVDPYSNQSSLGFQRQLGALMSVEADWTYSGDRSQLRTMNTNQAYDVATGIPYPTGGAAALVNANLRNRPYPGWGNTQQNRADGKANYHALQTSFTRRMSNHWQASATYTLAKAWQYDVLPLNPGCQYPMTMSGGQAVCNVPVTIVKDISENDWYVTGDQRHRVTFNGIWEMPHGFQLSGLYIFGDNGYATAQAGQDNRSIGVTTGRLRANGTVIPRNGINLPSIHRMDMRLQRRFALGGKVKIDGIFEMYNVFNHTNYDPTGIVVNERNARYGLPASSTTLAYQPRMLQFGFRTQF